MKRSIITLIGIMAIVLTTPIVLDAAPKKKITKAEADSIAQAERIQEVKDSLNAIKLQADNGDAEAMNEVGTWYYTGKHVAQDYDKAFEYWKNASLKKNVRATANLGLCYQYGHGVEKDSVDALKLYSKAIKDGYTALLKEREGTMEAQPFDAILVGVCYEKGYGTKKDMIAAAQAYGLAADKGSVNGMRYAGLALLNAKNPTKALPYFEKGAKAGDLSSTYWAGKLLLGDMGVAANPQQAIIYLLSAAEQGMPAAQNELGEVYRDGKGTTKNLEQSTTWFQRAAEQSNPRGMWNYAMALKEGEGVNQDYEQSLFWMSESVPNGYTKTFKRMMEQLDSIGTDPFANYVHGMKYLLINDNLTDANEQFKKVEKAKIEEGKVMQNYILANKKNPKSDPKKAAKNLEKLAFTNANAAFLLGNLYEMGNGVDQNMAQAIKLYNDAANMGYGKAQCYLADIYFEGRGTDKDLLKAVELYQKAEAQHQLTKNGALRLAQCYEQGTGGLTANPEKANALKEYSPKNNIAETLKLVP